MNKDSKTNKGTAKGALILTIGLIVSKIFGAIYKVPLAGILNTEGMGIYQLIFSVYAFFVTVVSGATPIGLSLMIGKFGENERKISKIMKNAFVLLTIMGLSATAILLSFARQIGNWQGEPMTHLGYVAVAPAIIAVAISGVIKGYFQGCSKMMPSALAEGLESAIKTGVGLWLALVLKKYGLEMAVVGALLGVTASEVLVTIVLALILVNRKPFKFTKLTLIEFSCEAKEIVKTIAPLLVCGMLFPLSQMVDGFLIVNLLSGCGTAKATGNYGLYSGYIATLVNLPVSLGITFGIAVIPKLSATLKERNVEDIKEKLAMVVKFSIGIVMPLAVLYLVFPQGILNILYPKLQESDINIAITLLQIGGVNALIITLATVLNSVLQGVGYGGYTIANTLLGVAVKTLVCVIIVPRIGIIGAGIASLCGNAFTAGLNVYKLTFLLGNNKQVVQNGGLLLASGVIIGIVGYAVAHFLGDGGKMFAIIALPLCIVYVMLILVLGVFSQEELTELPLGRYIAKISDAISIRGKIDAKLRKNQKTDG